MENTTRNGTTATATNNDAVSLTLLLGVSFYAGSHIIVGDHLRHGKMETKNAAVSASSFLLQNYPQIMIINKTPFDVRPLSRQDPSLEYSHVGYLHNKWEDCSSRDFMRYFDDPGIMAGQRWDPASSWRGMCLVNKIVAVLTIPGGSGFLQCTNYEYEHDDYEKWHFGPFKVVRHNENGTITYEKPPQNVMPPRRKSRAQGPNQLVTAKKEAGTTNSVCYIRMGGGDGCCVRSSWQSQECEPEKTHGHNSNYNYQT